MLLHISAEEGLYVRCDGGLYEVAYGDWVGSWGCGGKVCIKRGEEWIFDGYSGDYGCVGDLGDECDYFFERLVYPIQCMLCRSNVIGFHASSVQVGGEGILFLGRGHGGKSTVAMQILEAFEDSSLCSDDFSLIGIYDGFFEILGISGSIYIRDGGSEKSRVRVRCSEGVRLGSIVWVEGGDSFCVERVSGFCMFERLMDQRFVFSEEGVERRKLGFRMGVEMLRSCSCYVYRYDKRGSVIGLDGARRLVDIICSRDGGGY